MICVVPRFSRHHITVSSCSSKRPEWTERGRDRTAATRSIPTHRRTVGDRQHFPVALIKRRRVELSEGGFELNAIWSIRRGTTWPVTSRGWSQEEQGGIGARTRLDSDRITARRKRSDRWSAGAMYHWDMLRLPLDDCWPAITAGHREPSITPHTHTHTHGPKHTYYSIPLA